MIDYAIAFVLGFVAAGLIAFAMLPAVWARAQRLTRRRLAAVVPISMAEVSAARDHIRAEAAVAIRRVETRLENEREHRHAAMAEAGSLQAIIHRLTTGAKGLKQQSDDAEATVAAARTELAETRQSAEHLEDELKTTRLTLALNDELTAALRREIEAVRTGADEHRVEIVALRTRLSVMEDDLAERQHSLADLTAGGVERDGKLMLQAVELSKREVVLAALQADAAEAQRSSLAVDQRIAELVREIDERDVVVRQQKKSIAEASKREASLGEEIQRWKDEAQRFAGQRVNSVASSAIEAQLAALGQERARLQDEVAALKREAKLGWLQVAAENEQLRIEMARIAADIARETAARRGVTLPPLEFLPLNDDLAIGTSASRRTKTEADDRVDAPPA